MGESGERKELRKRALRIKQKSEKSYEKEPSGLSKKALRIKQKSPDCGM